MFGASIAVAFVYLINITKGEPSLVVLKNAEQPVTSTIITTRGRNLTLTCKMVTNEKQPFDGRVVWSKKANHLRLPIKKELKKQTVGRSKLRFEPLTVWDGGIYVCSSLKHNISKVVSVIVRPQKLVDHLRKRQKRVHNGYGRHQWGGWNTRRELPIRNSTPSLSDLMRDSFAKVIGRPKKKHKPTEPTWINIESSMDWDRSNEASGSLNSKSSSNFGSTNLETSSQPSYSYGPPVSKWSPDNSSKKYTLHESDNNSKPKSKYGVLYLMVFVPCLMLFTGVICMCISNPNYRMKKEHFAPAEAVCSHPVCRILRNSNRSVGCLFQGGPYDSATTPTAVVVTTHDITVVTADQMPDSVNRCAIDTPPSYTSSIENQSDSYLPPSYDVAFANMMQPAPPNYFSLTGICSATPDVAADCSSPSAPPADCSSPSAPPADCLSPSAPPDVVLDVPLGFARFMPSFFDNNQH